MANVKKDLQAVTRELKALTRKTERLVRAADKFEKDKAARKQKAKAKPKAKARPKKVVAKKPAAKKVAKVTATNQVLRIIKRSKKGVDVAALIKKTKFEDKKSDWPRFGLA